MTTFFSRLLLGAHFYVSSEGTGLRGCQFSQFSGGVHSVLSAAPRWRKFKTEGKPVWPPAPSRPPPWSSQAYVSQRPGAHTQEAL